MVSSRAGADRRRTSGGRTPRARASGWRFRLRRRRLETRVRRWRAAGRHAPPRRETTSNRQKLPYEEGDDARPGHRCGRDEDGLPARRRARHVIAEARGGGANLQAAGELEVEKVLHEVMEQAIGDRDIRPAAICLGIAGVDRAGDAEAVRGIMRRIGFKTRTLVVNDALSRWWPAPAIARAWSSWRAPARSRTAVTRRPARRGPAAGATCSGDEGGGFWIGRARTRPLSSGSSTAAGPRRSSPSWSSSRCASPTRPNSFTRSTVGGIHRYAIGSIAAVVHGRRMPATPWRRESSTARPASWPRRRRP